MFGAVEGFLTYSCEPTCAVKGEIRAGLLRVVDGDDDGWHNIGHHTIRFLIKLRRS